MGHTLYDSDSILYDQGKVVLSKKARNKYEELIEKIAIKKDGYIESYLVNETVENVWFDQFRIMSTGRTLDCPRNSLRSLGPRIIMTRLPIWLNQGESLPLQ